MSYGMEVYNSNNNLIFSSDRKTLQILDFGSVEITSEGQIKNINFTAASSKPKLWLQETGHYVIFPISSTVSNIVKPSVGNLSKNTNGNYNSFTIKSDVIGQINNQVSAGVSFPWILNYIVFI